MMNSIVCSVLRVLLALLVCTSQVHAAGTSFGASAAQFIGGYLLEKVIDGIWDDTTGKPDVEKLQNRITNLESSLGDSSPSLDTLKNSIHESMSLDEYNRLVNTALPGIANLLSNHENRLQVGALRLASYWNHNGSKMGLLAQGNRRIFVYVTPRSGMKGLVEQGTVLFSGTTDNTKYSGVARRFSRGLDPIEYSVSGPITNNGTKVTLNGKGIIRNSDGSVKRTFNGTLNFEFVSGPL
jgi:hypothetical protein